MEFSLTSDMLAKYYQWNDKHKKECKLYNNDGAIGGRLTFEFTHTGLGLIVKVKCGCGEVLDLSEYDTW